MNTEEIITNLIDSGDICGSSAITLMKLVLGSYKPEELSDVESEIEDLIDNTYVTGQEAMVLMKQLQYWENERSFKTGSTIVLGHTRGSEPKKVEKLINTPLVLAENS